MIESPLLGEIEATAKADGPTPAPPLEAPSWLQSAARRLSELTGLPADWDSYGALPPEPEVAIAALRILSGVMTPQTAAPQIVPTHRGGLSLEWHRRGFSLEVEVLASGEYTAAFERLSNGEERQVGPTTDLVPLAEMLTELSHETAALSGAGS
jgi:hypothetical protein